MSLPITLVNLWGLVRASVSLNMYELLSEPIFYFLSTICLEIAKSE